MAVDLRKMAIADTKGECSWPQPKCLLPDPLVARASAVMRLLHIARLRTLQVSQSTLSNIPCCYCMLLHHGSFLFAYVRLRSTSAWRPRSASRPTHVRTLHPAAWASERAPPFGSLMRIDLGFLAHVPSRLPLELHRSKRLFS